MGINSHEELQVWQRSIGLLKDIYRITEDFPSKERYRLVDQMCRATVSIPSNIAEGSSRKSTREFMRFISIATGSLAELETHIVIARELCYIGKEQYAALKQQTQEIGRMLNALYNALQRKLTELRTPDSALS